MRRILLFCASVALAFAPIAIGAQSAPAAGSLIKASGPSVYYLGTDGKRYVFPNENTYFTWYADFASVVTIDDAALAAYPIGANVTYKPGTRMLKIESDPRVYAVAKSGTLRWVETEGVARDLYGTDWNRMIDDISAAFFVNYRLGDPITSASQYDRVAEQAAATSIDADRAIEPAPEPEPEPTPEPEPEPAPSRSGTLTYTPDKVGHGQTFTLIATAQPSTAIWYVNVWFEGLHMRRCEFSPCGADVTFPGASSTATAVAEFVWGDGLKLYATTTIQAMAGASGVTITMRPEVKPNALHEIVADVDASFVAKTIDIYVDGNAVRGCNDVQQCRYLGTAPGAVGTTHEAYAIARDANGFARQSAVSVFTIVENPRPIVTMTPGKTALLAGESVDVLVEASDDEGIAYTEIATSDGSFSKRCETFRCTATVTRESSGTFYFIGTAADPGGAVGTASSSVITVQ